MLISLAYLHPQARQLGCRSWKPPTYRQIGLIRDTLARLLRFPSGIFSREAATRPAKVRAAVIAISRRVTSARAYILRDKFPLLSLRPYRDSYIRIICVYHPCLAVITSHVVYARAPGDKNAKLTSPRPWLIAFLKVMHDVYRLRRVGDGWRENIRRTGVTNDAKVCASLATVRSSRPRCPTNLRLPVSMSERGCACARH